MSVDEMARFLTNFDCFVICEHEGACKSSNDLEMEVANEK